MIRFTSFAIAAPLALALSGGLAGNAHAQSQAELAAQANEEGKQLMYADKYAEAAKKFQEAVARVPEAKYFVNLCTARLQEGKLDEALTACNAVDLNNPTPDQKDRTGKLVERIHQEADKQHLALHPGGGGGGNTNLGPTNPNPSNPNPTNPTNPTNPNAPIYTPTVGRPLDTNLAAEARPDHRYTWTAGIDFFGGGGRIGQSDFYGSAAGGFRVKGDVMLDPVRRIGIQGYLQFQRFSQGRDQDFGAMNLDVGDIGLAMYKHFCLGGTSRACLTPLAGIQLAMMGPVDPDAGEQLFNYAAGGGRFELAFTYAFGRRYEHALSLLGGVNVYSPVFSGPSPNDPSGELTASERGLDAWGAAGYLGIGYTYRFNTPVGATPFIILE
jgi:tetratricopeptide (TPR) repeat protein